MNLLKLALVLFSTAALAQQPVPKDLPSSGLEWAQPANPQQYFDATGRRSAVFGKQTGQFEAWIWPIKVLHGFRLEFQQQGMPEPVRGEAWLAQVVTRPESTTLVYAHPLFTVREIIWAPRDEPALVVFFDVDSAKPLSITAKFVPDFKPMWPASLGGQHSDWVQEDKAFALTDGTGNPTALVGSPAVAAFTEFTDHSLVGGEMLLRMQVTPEQARAGLIPLVMSLSMENEQGARTVYRDVLGRLRQLYDARVAYHKDFLARTLQIETPDPIINRAFAWAKVAIDSGWVCHSTPAGARTAPAGGPAKEDNFCGIVAGYGPSGDGERPGFAWWFGGDGLIATWAMLDYGDIEGALQELRFLKAQQRADGKMMHEMPQSVDLVDWFGKYGFAYMHADTTPMYLYTLGQYWRRTGDRKFLEEFWPSAKRAYEWCLTTVDPKDGLMDLTKAGLGAIEVGVLKGKVTKDIYTEGFWVGGLDAMADMAFEMGDLQTQTGANARLATAMKSLETQWWNPEGRYFAFGVTASGERADMIGAWPSVLVALGANPSPILRRSPLKPDLKKALDEVQVLAQADLHSDWGDRWISDKNPAFDPVSYNNGTVWPFMNVFVNWAEFLYGSPAAFSTLRETAALTGIQSPGYMPEHMNGERFLPGERSVPHQLFSSAGVVIPTVRGLLGLKDVFRVRGVPFSSAFISNGMPGNWDFLRFSNLRISRGTVSGEFRREPGKLTIVSEYHGPNEALSVTLGGGGIPVGTERFSILRDGERWPRFLGQTGVPGLTVGSVPGEHVAEERFEGGVFLVPPVASPQPGARSSALKVISIKGDSFRAPDKPYHAELTIAGLGGCTYDLDFITTAPNVSTDFGKLTRTAQGYRLTLSFEGTDYVTRVVRLRY